MLGHKNNAGSRFTSRYHVTRVVCFEQFSNIDAGIAREKQIKGLLRAKKIALIEAMNPDWKDLSADERGPGFFA